MMRRMYGPTLSVALAAALAACSEDEVQVLQQTDIVDADIGQCPDGGLVVVTGTDDNGDGVLDGDEIIASTAVCSGADGAMGTAGQPGTGVLIVTSDDVGASCPTTGLKVDVGVDTDGDGTLSTMEVQQSAVVCDGAQGSAGLTTVSQTREATPAECDRGGTVFEYGLDDDGSETLETEEVDGSEVLCQGDPGETVVLQTAAEAPGVNCAVGGLRLERGVDADDNGTLEGVEIESTTYVCNLLRTLVEISAELAGTSTDCPTGGSRIDVGLDRDGDDVLDPDEIDSTSFVCSGEAGASTLVTSIEETAGDNCASGGRRIQIGDDTSGDGILQPSEVTSSRFVCNGDPGPDGGGNNAVRVAVEDPGVNCPSGGVRIDSGPDANANGTLDDGEETETAFSCSGVTTETLVATVVEPAGSNCTDGGVAIQTGLDANGNGVLDAPGEVQSTTFVCDTPPAVPLAIIEPTSLASVFETISFEVDVEAVGGTAGSYAWSVAGGSLPPGLTLDPTGTPATTLSGAVTSTGTFTFSIQVEDFFGATASRQYTLVVESVPCAPGRNGLADVNLTIIGHNQSSLTGTAGQGVAVDTSTSGYVYVSSSSNGVYRISKDGTMGDDVDSLASLTTSQFGNEIEISGSNIYVASDDTNCQPDCVSRISTDGGLTFTNEELVAFSSSSPGPVANDDVRGLEQIGDRLYMMTHDFTTTEIWSISLTGTFPATPQLEGSFSNFDVCSSLTSDDLYFYTGCDGDDIVRIDRTTYTAESIYSDTNLAITSSGMNGIAAQDANGDGVADVLWFNGDNNNSTTSGEAFYVCDPAGTTLPAFAGTFALDAVQDEGLAFDPVNQVIWMHDENDDLFQFD